VIKFVSDLWKVGCFFGFPTNKTARYDITEVLLKVALNTINIKKTDYICIQKDYELYYSKCL